MLAVRVLVENPGWRVTLGEAARRTAEERLDVTRYGKRLCELYRSIMNQR